MKNDDPNVLSFTPAEVTEMRRREYLRPDGSFKPGNPGRPKGVRNRVDVELRQAVTGGSAIAGDEIAEERGWKERGLLAYMKHLALDEPKVMGALLAKCIPTQVVGKDDAPVKIQVVTGIDPTLGEPGSAVN